MPENKKMNDEQLVAAIKNGSKQALAQLYKDSYMSIRGYILKNSGNSYDAEDIVQDAVIVIWEKIHHNQLELKAKLSTLVFAISRNLWLKRLNKLGKQTVMDGIISENLTVKDDAFATENRQIVMQMMENLGANCKDILTFFYFDALDMNTIAQKLNYNNADTAKAKKYQCFKQLQQLVLNTYHKKDLI